MSEKDGNFPRNRMYIQGNRGLYDVKKYEENYERIFGRKKLPHGTDRKGRSNALVGPLVKD